MEDIGSNANMVNNCKIKNEPASPFLGSTIIDTPGLLHTNRTTDYTFPKLINWFAERCDLILILLHPEKISDMTDEFQQTIELTTKRYNRKIRFVITHMDRFTDEEYLQIAKSFSNYV
eukprot:UN28398